MMRKMKGLLSVEACRHADKLASAFFARSVEAAGAQKEWSSKAFLCAELLLTNFCYIHSLRVTHVKVRILVKVLF